MRLPPLNAALDSLLSSPLGSVSDPRRRRLPGVRGLRRASAISTGSGDSAGSAVTAESGDSGDEKRRKPGASPWASSRRLSLRVKARESSAELLAMLNESEADVMVHRGSEREFSGRYCNFFPLVGCFTCKGCREPLYSAAAKFDARSGYPSFDRCFEGAVTARTEIGWRRTVALRCSKCAGHLGHLFEGEWLSATNERHSVNSVTLEYDPNPCISPETCLRSAQV